MATDFGPIQSVQSTTPSRSTDFGRVGEARGLLAHSQGLIDRYRSEEAQAKQVAIEANKPSTIAKETAKGVVSQLATGPVRALRSGVDFAIEKLTGKKPAGEFTGFMGEPVKTYQGELEAGASPLGVAGGAALDVASILPIGRGISAAKSLLPKATGALGKVAAPILSPVKSFLAQRAEKKTVQALQSTAETMTKKERKLAIEEGRQIPTITGGGKYIPSKTEKTAGKILTGRLGKNPVKNVPIVKSEIAQRGKEAEDFLSANTKAITNKEHADMFAVKRADMAKYSTDAEMKAYDEQVGIFSRQLPGRGAFDTPNYYKALKEYESNVTSRLPKGKEALLTETGSAKLQAAKDVREVVRDMIGSKNPEFKSKMYDLASLYDALDNVITKAEAVGTFAKRHPVITSGVKWGGAGAAGAVGAGGVYKASQLGE